MSGEAADKHQILLRGGRHEERSDTVISWLNFLTDPVNLQPSLPELTLNCFLSGNGRGIEVQVAFSETQASLQSLRLELKACPYQRGLPVFQETDPQIIEARSTYSVHQSSNPHHLHDWIFNLFMNTGLEHLHVEFLNAELPDLFDHLPNLKTVTLCNSKIVRLPPSFFRSPRLTTLDISMCSMADVPHETGQLQSLQHLTFSQPCAGGVLGSLRGLISLASYCDSFIIPADITQLTNLKYLTVCDVVPGPAIFLNFPKLEYLYFHVRENSVAFNVTEANMPALKELNTNCPAAFASFISRFQRLEIFIAGGTHMPQPALNTLTNSLRQVTTLTHLALPGLGLTNIDFCLSLTALQWLDLNTNAITHLPPGLAHLPGLQFLDLCENKFVHVPAGWIALYQSGRLHLRGNPIVRFPDLNLRNETKQKILHAGGVYTLTHKKDETFIEWLEFLTDPLNLQPGLPDLTLQADKNFLRVSFDSGKPSLRSLKIELSDYLLAKTDLFLDTTPHKKDSPLQDESRGTQYLRAWVHNLFRHIALEELQVPFRNTELPDRFDSLPNLKRIDFSRSKLTQLPPGIFSLNSLQILNLNDTPLIELPENINQLTNLVSINLNRTALSLLPANFIKLFNLESLYLEGTPLARLPDNVNALARLKTVHLDTSALEQFPRDFFQLPALENLHLQGTSMPALPDCFDLLINLRNVSLNAPNLTQFPQSIFTLQALEYLNLDRTSLTELPDRFDTLTNLKHVSLHISTLKNLPRSFFQLHALEQLNLEETDITGLPDHFDTLPRLKKVSFRNAKITALPSSFFLLPALEWLDLNTSSLPEVPADLGRLRTLQHLVFSQPCVPAAWTGLTELTALHGYCPDFHVPEEFSQLIKLKTLHLSSVASAAYESMNLPELETLKFQITARSMNRLQGNLPRLKHLTTNIAEVFRATLQTAVKNNQAIQIV